MSHSIGSARLWNCQRSTWSTPSAPASGAAPASAAAAVRSPVLVARKKSSRCVRSQGRDPQLGVAVAGGDVDVVDAVLQQLRPGRGRPRAGRPRRAPHRRRSAGCCGARSSRTRAWVSACGSSPSGHGRRRPASGTPGPARSRRQPSRRALEPFRADRAGRPGRRRRAASAVAVRQAARLVPGRVAGPRRRGQYVSVADGAGRRTRRRRGPRPRPSRRRASSALPYVPSGPAAGSVTGGRRYRWPARGRRTRSAVRGRPGRRRVVGRSRARRGGAAASRA